MTSNQKNVPHPVIETAEQDYRPQIVAINEAKIASLSFSAEDKNILADNEIKALENKNLRESIAFLLSLNSINYQFWSVDKWGSFTRYQNNGKIGALAMFEGFEKFYDALENKPFNLQNMSTHDVHKFWGDIPEAAQRVIILQESCDPKKRDTAIDAVMSDITERGILDIETAAQVVKILPQSYTDPYFKKIQLALYEISHCAQSRGYPHLECDITVAADYQVPKVLEGLGVLEYNEELVKKIEKGLIIKVDSVEEKAIRAATILACDKISKTHDISIPALDRQLWLNRNNFKTKFHLTPTPRY